MAIDLKSDLGWKTVKTVGQFGSCRFERLVPPFCLSQIVEVPAQGLVVSSKMIYAKMAMFLVYRKIITHEANKIEYHCKNHDGMM